MHESTYSRVPYVNISFRCSGHHLSNVKYVRWMTYIWLVLASSIAWRDPCNKLVIVPLRTKIVKQLTVDGAGMDVSISSIEVLKGSYDLFLVYPPLNGIYNSKISESRSIVKNTSYQLGFKLFWAYIPIPSHQLVVLYLEMTYSGHFLSFIS